MPRLLAGVVVADSRQRGEARVRGLERIRLDPRVALAGIVALALAARLVAVGSSLHVDDAYSWLVASQPSPSAFLRQLAATENTPPLFYLLLTPLPINNLAWLRLPAAIPGALLCVVLYCALRRPLGQRTSLLAALGVAVSPFLITYSDLARGFMLEDLALLFALWAVLRLGERESARRWAVFVLAGVVALYTEYSAAIFLVALTAAAIWVGKPRRQRMALMGGLTLLSVAPWIPEIVRAENQVHKTKLSPMFSTPTVTRLRDSVVTLALGENGGTSKAAGRWLEFAVMLALAGAAAFVLRHGWSSISSYGRRAIVLIALTGTLTLVGHALVAVVGIDVFTERYMTILIPLAAALGAAALVSVGSRPLLVGASVLLVALGLVEVGRRYHSQYEPNFAPVRAAALATHPRTVLTNTPIVLFYLRSLRPQFDRPSNLGPGRASTCARPCLIIDDTRVTGGPPRLLPGPHDLIGPYLLTLER